MYIEYINDFFHVAYNEKSKQQIIFSSLKNYPQCCTTGSCSWQTRPWGSGLHWEDCGRQQWGRRRSDGKKQWNEYRGKGEPPARGRAHLWPWQVGSVYQMAEYLGSFYALLALAGCLVLTKPSGEDLRLSESLTQRSGQTGRMI